MEICVFGNVGMKKTNVTRPLAVSDGTRLVTVTTWGREDFPTRIFFGGGNALSTQLHT